MPLKALVGAMLVQIALTLGLLLWLGVARARSAQRGEVRIKDIALSSDAWPDRIKQVANAFGNQLELPVLFYVAALLAIVTGTVDTIVVGLAWTFVTLRLWHAQIHVTHNTVLRRFQVYIGGFVMVAVMWAYIGLRVLTA